MARVIFHTKQVVVLESANLNTVMTHDTEWLGSFTKSSPLAMFAAISEARHLSTYPVQERTEFWSDVKRVSYDDYLALEGDCYEVNQRMNQPYPMVNRED